MWTDMAEWRRRYYLQARHPRVVFTTPPQANCSLCVLWQNNCASVMRKIANKAQLALVEYVHSALRTCAPVVAPPSWCRPDIFSVVPRGRACACSPCQPTSGCLSCITDEPRWDWCFPRRSRPSAPEACDTWWTVTGSWPTADLSFSFLTFF